MELEHGKGTLTRDEDGNYDLQVLPGETIALMCAPEYVLGEYQWKRDSTVLYSSINGVQISESDPDYERIRLEPRSPSKWDEVWWLIVKDMQEDEVFSYFCSSASYGQTLVNISATYGALG